MSNPFLAALVAATLVLLPAVSAKGAVADAAAPAPALACVPEVIVGVVFVEIDITPLYQCPLVGGTIQGLVTSVFCVLLDPNHPNRCFRG